MSEKFKQRFGIIVKSVMPAVAVMVTGLIATYILYGNHPHAQAEGAQFSANEVSGVEPAAGAPADQNKAAPATDEKAMPPDAGTGTTIMKDEGEDSGETGASTDNTMASGATPAPDAGTTDGEPAPAPAPAPAGQ